MGLLTGLCIARICVLFITMCLTRSRCLISICQMSEVIRSLVYFQRLCLLYERGSSEVLSLFRYITCAEYTHFYGGKKPGKT